jgi:hypothetical protein
MAMPSQTENNIDPKVWGLAAAGVLALLFALPLLLGGALWWAGRNYLRKAEAVILAVTATLVIVVAPPATLGAYFRWVVSLGKGLFGGGFAFPPVLAVLVLSALVVAAVQLILPTRLGSKVQARLKRGDDGHDIMPSDAEVDRLSVVAPGDDQMVASPHHKKRGTKNGEPEGPRGFPLAIDRSGKPVFITEDEMKTHAVVLGSTGSGKTVTLQTMSAGLLDLGWSVVMLDLKEDTAEGGLRDYMQNYASTHGISYQEVALSNPNPAYWFNPLSGMAIDEAINAILALQDFDDGHWQAINRTMIGQIVTLFYDAHGVDPDRFPEADMYQIGQAFIQPDIKLVVEERVKAVIAARPDRSREDFLTLIKPGEDQRKAAIGLGSRIVNMYESEAGRRVLRPGANRETMDITRGGVCYVGLNSLGLSELARVVSTSALLRLSAWAGARTTGAVVDVESARIAVIIDEANFIDRKEVQNLLSRARSAGIAVVLATQGPQDWNDKDGQDWDKVVNNVNIGIIMRQGTEEAAEMCADFIGRRETRTLLAQIRDGEETESGTVKESLEHAVPSNKIRDLGQGQAILKISSPKKRIEWTKVNYRPSGAMYDSHL